MKLPETGDFGLLSSTPGHTFVGMTLQETLPLHRTDFNMLSLPGLPAECHGQLGGGGGHPSLDSLWAPHTPPQDQRYRDQGRSWSWQPLSLGTSQAWSSKPALQHVPTEFPHLLLPGETHMCLGVLHPMTKDHKENKAMCLEEELIWHCLRKGFPMTTSADETGN